MFVINKWQTWNVDFLQTWYISWQKVFMKSSLKVCVFKLNTDLYTFYVTWSKLIKSKIIIISFAYFTIDALSGI